MHIQPVNYHSASSEVLIFLDDIFFQETGEHLDTLQQKIIKGVISRQKYSDIADEYKCSVSHVKETASEVWRIFSSIFGEKINKGNFEATVGRKGIVSFGKSIQINQISNLVANGICIGDKDSSLGNDSTQSNDSNSSVKNDKSLIDRMLQEGLSTEQINRILDMSA